MLSQLSFHKASHQAPVFSPGPERKAAFASLMLGEVRSKRSFGKDLPWDPGWRNIIHHLYTYEKQNKISGCAETASKAPYMVAGMYLAQFRKNTFLQTSSNVKFIGSRLISK